MTIHWNWSTLFWDKPLKKSLTVLDTEYPAENEKKTGDIGLNIPIQIAKKTSTIHDDFLHIIRLRQAGPSCFFAAGSVLAKKPTNFGPTPPMAATAWFFIWFIWWEVPSGELT